MSAMHAIAGDVVAFRNRPHRVLDVIVAGAGPRPPYFGLACEHAGPCDAPLRPVSHWHVRRLEVPMGEKHVHENVAPHSVALTTTAKGKVQVEVKVYDADPDRAADRALEVLQSVKTRLGDQYATA